MLLHCQSLQFPRDHAKPRHVHASAQLIYVAEGGLICESDVIRWHMMSRQFAWIPRGVGHNAYALSPVTGVLLRIDAGNNQIWPQTITVANASQLLTALAERICQRSSDGCEPPIERLMAVLADEIALLPPLPQQLPLPHSPRLRQLATDILSTLQENWDLDTTAARYGFSRSTLTRLFSRETGMSLGRWLSYARLNTARMMIEDGQPVSETAERVGYHTVSGFCAAYRQHFGTSPTETGYMR